MNKYKLDTSKPIRLFECFSGIGTQAMAFDRLGLDYEVVGISEIDKFALLSYASIHTDYLKIRETYFEDKQLSKEYMIDVLQSKNVGYDFKKGKHSIYNRTGIETVKDYYLADLLTKNYGDISLIKGSDLPKDIDMLTYSFPCFVGDTLVMTSTGYKKIADVIIGDLVLTHDNTFKKVIRTINNGLKNTVEVKMMGARNLKTTKNHKFYTRERYKEWDNKKRVYNRKFKDVEWKRIDEINRGDVIGVAVNQNEIIPNTENALMTSEQDFWYLIGQYMGDGWYDTSGHAIYLGKSEKDTKEVTDVLRNLGLKYTIYKERTVNKIRVASKEMHEYVQQFGNGASNKRLTNDVLDLPIELLASFIDGYVDSDGSVENGVYKVTSVSEELIYGVAACVAKVYKTPYSIYNYHHRKTRSIEGRFGYTLPNFELKWKKDIRKQDKAFYENGYVWLPFYEIEDNGVENVYDLEVEENHSYTIYNTIVHNCTDLSNAGKQAGLVGTRSGLVYEVFRILIELEHINNKPKTLIMENVIALIQKKFIKDFENMQDDLVKLGYTNSVMRMNARDYGVAQRRDRVFMVSTITNEYVETPKPFELELRLGDYLESEVDEKYILSEKAINWLSTDHPTFKRKDKFLKNQKDRYGDHVANTITTRESNDVDSTYIKETNDTICLNSKVNGKQPSLQDRVYSSKGVMPAITTSFHPSILEPTKVAQRGRYNEQGELEQKIEVGKDGISNALTTVQKDNYVLESSDEIIRKLTPKECWRLMGIDDSNFEKAEQVMSNAQLYKQAGNAIVVDVFAAILKEML